MRDYTTPNCGRCGKFVGPDGDCFAPWGHSGMEEPPDDVFLCGSCTEAEYREDLRNFLRFGIPSYDHRSRWHPSHAWLRARSTVRGMFKHGLAERPVRHEKVRREVRNVTRSWFCTCGRPEKHPAHSDDYRELRRLGLKRCKFTRAIERHIGGRLPEVRTYCSCGFVTPWVPTSEDRLWSGPMHDHLGAHQCAA